MKKKPVYEKLKLISILSSKFFIIMKLVLSILILTMTQVYGKDIYSQTTRLTLNLKGTTVKHVIEAIQEQSEFYFMYSSSQINLEKKVDVIASKKKIDYVLSDLFEDTDTYFLILGKQIVLSPKELLFKEIKNLQDLITITGIVTDDAGEGIPGVNILEKSTGNVTITDFNGAYAIEDVPGDGVLIFSFVGFQSQETPIEGRTTIDVQLKESSEVLDEVVIVGYGTQKKANLTGAISQVSSEVMKNRPLINAAQGLQGVIPNLNISFNSGKPDAGANFNIRGNTSINGGSPLILVDGQISSINNLNPNDIESYTVLKDAASAAIYGARAAYGVILITTKKGKKGQPFQVTYNNNFSWSRPSRLPAFPNSYDWATGINQAYDYDGGAQFFSDELLALTQAYNNDPANNPDVSIDTMQIQHPIHLPNNPAWAYHGNTNWIDKHYDDAAYAQQHNLSIRGGGEKTGFYASVGAKDQNGIFHYGKDNYKRYNLVVNVNTEPTKWLGVNFATKFNHIKNNNPYTYGQLGSLYHAIYRQFPLVPEKLPNGDWAGVEGRKFNKSLAPMMAEGGRVIGKTNDLLLTGGIELRPFKHFKLIGDYSVKLLSRTNRSHKKTIYQTWPLEQEPTAFGGSTPNSVSLRSTNNDYQTLNIYGEYENTISENHYIKLMTGYNQEYSHFFNLYGYRDNLVSNDIPSLALAGDEEDFTREYESHWAIRGVFFRVNYAFRNRYLIEVNGRYDGSSRFPKENRFGLFPSVSAGWRISEESFFNPLMDIITNLKLRGSYGSLGNQNVGLYRYLSSMGTRTDAYLLGGEKPFVITPPGVASRNSSWEKVTTTNLGIDMGLFKNRLDLSFDVYERITSDMLVAKSYPSVLGSSGGEENLAELKTKGWELSIGWKDKIESLGDFRYDIRFILSDYQAEITKYDNPTKVYTDYYVGKKLGEIWGYETQGFIQTDEEATEMGTTQQDIAATWYVGDVRYKDLNGDNLITNGDLTVENPGDKKIIGNSTPRFRFGFTTNVFWRNFDLRIFFQGVGKRTTWVNSPLLWGYYGGSIWQTHLMQWHLDNSWSEENQNSYLPRPSYRGRSKQVQTKYLQNAAYIRLKDITIGYTIPKSVLKKVRIENLKVFISGQNLWEHSKMVKIFDPEAVGSGKHYPFQRTISFGANLTF